MNKFSIKVIMFAIRIGDEEISYPQMIQKLTPVINIIKVIEETSSAFFVFKVLINWGRKAAVVKIAAKYPKNSIFKEFIIYISHLKRLLDLPSQKNTRAHHWKNTYK